MSLFTTGQIAERLGVRTTTEARRRLEQAGFTPRRAGALLTWDLDEDEVEDLLEDDLDDEDDLDEEDVTDAC